MRMTDRLSPDDAAKVDALRSLGFGKAKDIFAVIASGVVTQVGIGRAMGAHPSDLVYTIKRLAAAGLIEIVPCVVPAKTKPTKFIYRLNPDGFRALAEFVATMPDRLAPTEPATAETAVTA